MLCVIYVLKIDIIRKISRDFQVICPSSKIMLQRNDDVQDVRVLVNRSNHFVPCPFELLGRDTCLPDETVLVSLKSYVSMQLVFNVRTMLAGVCRTRSFCFTAPRTGCGDCGMAVRGTILYTGRDKAR